MTSARRGEGVSQNWTIVREVAWIKYYESIPNVDRGTLRRSGTKNWKFVDVICTSPLTWFATLVRETESLLKRHKHSSATSNDYRETLRETWLPMICTTKNYVYLCFGLRQYSIFKSSRVSHFYEDHGDQLEDEWIDEFKRQSLNWRNPPVLKPRLVKNVLAARDCPCINPLT